MSQRQVIFAMLGVILAVASIEAIALQEETEPMGFFITSVGPGNGANLGGLAGADAHCQKLADAVGAGNRTWRAYLSTQASGGQSAVDARDRIGDGPWANAKGLVIGASVDDLHYNNGAINYEHALNEKGERVNSGASGDSPNMHDILTGTQLDGTAFPPGEDRTCGNWTKSGEGSAMVGHHDLDVRRPAAHGTWRTRRGAAARRTWWGPGGTGSSTVSQRSDGSRCLIHT